MILMRQLHGNYDSVGKVPRLLRKVGELDNHRVSFKIRSRREASTRLFPAFKTVRHIYVRQCDFFTFYLNALFPL